MGRDHQVQLLCEAHAGIESQPWCYQHHTVTKRVDATKEFQSYPKVIQDFLVFSAPQAEHHLQTQRASQATLNFALHELSPSRETQKSRFILFHTPSASHTTKYPGSTTFHKASPSKARIITNPRATTQPMLLEQIPEDPGVVWAGKGLKTFPHSNPC